AHQLQVPGLNVRVAANQALGGSRRELEAKPRAMDVCVADDFKNRPRKGQICRLRLQHPGYDAPAIVLYEARTPAGVDALRASGPDPLAGWVGVQRVEPAIDIDLDVRTVRQILDTGDLDQPPV